MSARRSYKAFRTAQLLGSNFNAMFLEALWSRDCHAEAILTQLTHADQVQRKSVFTTGMPGTGKTRSLAIACIMTATVAQRRVIYATVSNEPVRSVTACLYEMLSDAHEVARAAFRRISAEEESKIGSMSLDLECHVNTFKALANVMMIALTCGKLESGLVTNERNSWTPIRDFVDSTWLQARDEGQQAGVPVVSPHSTFCARNVDRSDRSTFACPRQMASACVLPTAPLLQSFWEKLLGDITPTVGNKILYNPTPEDSLFACTIFRHSPAECRHVLHWLTSGRRTPVLPRPLARPPSQGQTGQAGKS